MSDTMSGRRDMLDLVKYIAVVLLMKVELINTILWNEVRCSMDPDQIIKEGKISEIGRFPWLGVIQHNFYVGDKEHFAITSGILIHPAYSIAPADDMSKIPYEMLSNNTKFILWHSKTLKYALEVVDYVLHPEFEEGTTIASIAFVHLQTFGETGVGPNARPVLPICLPLKGAGTYSDALYVVRLSDASGEIEKEAFKMNYVDDKDCTDFYRNNKLLYKSTSPVAATCAVAEKKMSPCVWDAGAALISQQSWGYWKLLGFSVRGPGCGAPARFLSLYDYLPWINDIATPIPEEQAQMYRIGVRRISPVKITLYNAQKNVPKYTGYCDRQRRGTILYKDAFEMIASKNFIQGFYFLVVHQLAEFTCAEVSMPDVLARTNTGVWIEHNCNREISGIAPGQDLHRIYDYRKRQCFLYFKSALFVEFRFHFSFRTDVEVSVYGRKEIPRIIPNPFITDQTTDKWLPTAEKIKWDSFYPYNLWEWYM